MTRAVIFDLDDTLYPHTRFVRSGFAAVAHYVERRHSILAHNAFATLCRAQTFGARGRELQALCAEHRLPNDMVPELIEVFREHRPTLWPFHDACEALTALRLNGWRLAILTNGIPSVQAGKVAALGLQPFVDHIVFAEDHAPGGKPAAVPFVETLHRLQVRAESCVMVGDDLERDILGARQIGIHTIRVARTESASVIAADAESIVKSLSVVPEAAAALVDEVRAHVA